jgi:RNA polymerase sigma factor (sigma-70 family)
MTDAIRRALLFHFCRLQRPAVALAPAAFEQHLDRTFALYRRKNSTITFAGYLDSLYSLDWNLCCACLDGDERAWELLFAARTGRSDCLLVDALRARAARLYPRDEEKQESAVAEFWSQLLVAESPAGTPVLARYDGQRPLVPWLIRVFQNAHISKLRAGAGVHGLPDDDLALPLPTSGDGRWHEAFCQAARESLAGLGDSELLILGLRLRYRMSQREVAHLLGVHEGTVSRQTDKLRDRCLEQIRARLLAQGWTGDDLTGFILTEMGPLLLDEPRLGADRLAGLLAARGRALPAAPTEAAP